MTGPYFRADHDSNPSEPTVSQKPGSPSEPDSGATNPVMIPGETPADQPLAREGDEQILNPSIPPLVFPPFRRDTRQILHRPLRPSSHLADHPGCQQAFDAQL